VVAVMLPLTAASSAPGHRSPAREMVDAGVPVALGTDCSPNTWVEAMPTVLGAAVHAGHLTPAEALTAATVNAAHASGLSDAGALRVGEPADFCLFPVTAADRLGYRYDLRPTAVFRQGKPVSSA
jgi:imidazolonepropionase